MTYLLVFLGGVLGGPLRYLLDQAVQKRHDSVFPWGTLIVNLVGAFVLGALTGAAAAHGLPEHLMLLLASGLCGALTTFSTFAFETVRLVEEGSLAAAMLNVVVSLALGVLAATAGYALLTWL